MTLTETMPNIYMQFHDESGEYSTEGATWCMERIHDTDLVYVPLARAEAAEKQLAEARAALDGCGIGGIYDEFESLPDAIGQMALHIKEQGERIAAKESDGTR